MSVAVTLAAIAVGRRPENDGLLGTCLLEWSGGEAYGEEDILALLRAAPFDPGADAILVETATAAAWIGADAALVADMHDGRVGRLWRIGQGAPPVPEPAVAVAFDPDLRQDRGDVHARAGDHPDLARDEFAAVLAAGRALVAVDHGQHRARAFVLRAFSAGERTVALFAVHRLSAGAVREASFMHALARIGGDRLHLIAEPARATPWTPRL